MYEIVIDYDANEADKSIISEGLVSSNMNPNRDFDHSRHLKNFTMDQTEDQHYLGFHFDPYFRSHL